LSTIPVLVDEEFAGAGADVPDGLRRGYRRLAHALPNLRRDPVAGRLLDHLLMAPLDRALAFEEVDRVAVRVGQHLDLDMARLLHELLDVEGVVAEGGLRFAACPRQRLGQILRLVHETHALAAAARAGLHHHGKADLLGEGHGLLVRERPGGAGYDRDPGLLHGPPGGHLVAHGAHHVARGPDEDDALLRTEIRKLAVFRQESVAGMDGIDAGPLGDVEHALHHQV
jgi:hypothetical protein